MDNIIEMNEEIKNCFDCVGAAKRSRVGAEIIGNTILFIGKHPAQHEVYAGRPFSGPSGMLLRNLLKHYGLDRETSFTNCIKCYPPFTRLKEIRYCKNKFLVREIELIKPKVICILGTDVGRVLFERVPLWNEPVFLEDIPTFVFPNPAMFLGAKEADYYLIRFETFLELTSVLLKKDVFDRSADEVAGYYVRNLPVILWNKLKGGEQDVRL